AAVPRRAVLDARRSARRRDLREEAAACRAADRDRRTAAWFLAFCPLLHAAARRGPAWRALSLLRHRSETLGRGVGVFARCRVRGARAVADRVRGAQEFS